MRSELLGAGLPQCSLGARSRRDYWWPGWGGEAAGTNGSSERRSAGAERPRELSGDPG